MSYPAGEPLTSKITKAVVTYLNDCIVGHREPWDEGGLYNAVEEAFASDSHNPPDARVRELEASHEVYERLLRGEATSEEYVAALRTEAAAYGPRGRWTQLRRERDEARAEVERLREALTLVQKLVNIPSEQILDDTERTRRIKLVVDTCLAAREALEAGER